MEATMNEQMMRAVDDGEGIRRLYLAEAQKPVSSMDVDVIAEIAKRYNAYPAHVARIAELEAENAKLRQLHDQL